VVDAGLAIRRRWPFVEDVGFRVFAVVHALVKDFVFFPKR